VADAEANLGESEVREALLAKAEHFVRLGDRPAAEAAFEATATKTVAVGQKMDLLFSLMRLHFLFFDYAAVKADIRKVRSCPAWPHLRLTHIARS